ncbi:hypothetical protein FA15DRAFT_701697 [Coprinopsis marcescibilis]|uniref:CENP-V/GFA domain-containing protein n=1 Tax=Coprinopsis marcescibilis TaxID=230819 RepID=A0A5C3L4S5_COPMA|nr:hypothetical protein FA15DRAFT_701697 [Coprinopsis marcescibilis]
MDDLTLLNLDHHHDTSSCFVEAISSIYKPRKYVHGIRDPRPELGYYWTGKMTTFINAGCFCGSNEFKIPLETAKLPAETAMCHCNICRHSTGATNTFGLAFSGPPLTLDSTDEYRVPGNLSNLTQYNSSPNLTRYFCTKCSCKILAKAEGKDGTQHWYASVGALEQVDGIVKLARHVYVGDTLDGGISNHIPQYAGVTIPRFKQSGAGETVDADWGTKGSANSTADSKDVLRFHCHCKGVEVYAKRATEIKDPNREWWFVPGKTSSDPIRFATKHCVCTSCRRTSGAMPTTWTFVPETHILDGRTMEPINLSNAEKRPPTLRQFESSPGVYREFCGSCGATVFYWEPANLPKMDIATGLLDQEQSGGVLGNDWFKWSEKGVGYREDEVIPEFLDAITKGVMCGK